MNCLKKYLVKKKAKDEVEILRGIEALLLLAFNFSVEP